MIRFSKMRGKKVNPQFKNVMHIERPKKYCKWEQFFFSFFILNPICYQNGMTRQTREMGIMTNRKSFKKEKNKGFKTIKILKLSKKVKMIQMIKYWCFSY
jgi:hypothetical protein